MQNYFTPVSTSGPWKFVQQGSRIPCPKLASPILPSLNPFTGTISIAVFNSVNNICLTMLKKSAHIKRNNCKMTDSEAASIILQDMSTQLLNVFCYLNLIRKSTYCEMLPFRENRWLHDKGGTQNYSYKLQQSTYCCYKDDCWCLWKITVLSFISVLYFALERECQS